MLDGASKWQQAKYITLPLLKTVIVMMFILSVGGIFGTADDGTSHRSDDCSDVAAASAAAQSPDSRTQDGAE